MDTEYYWNPAVHKSKDGKPVRKLDNTFKLKTNWKNCAVDRIGRKYNPDLHGEIRLDGKGYLVELVEAVIPTALDKAVDGAESLGVSLNDKISFNDNISFNLTIHEKTENDDPLREEDGSIRLKKNWKERVVDRQGRKFNEKIHEENHEIDSEGYLKVRRRGASTPISATNRTEAFVNKYREDGYAYYVMNNEGGRMEQFTQNHWEPVLTEHGQATIDVGQARSPNTKAILMRKPIEWHEADQIKKRELIAQNYKSTTAPKEGQYKPEETPPGTPLR